MRRLALTVVLRLGRYAVLPARDVPARFDEEWRKKAQAWVTVGR
jgi:hypothetical protein